MDSPPFSDLLAGAFGYRPKNPGPPVPMPAASEPEKRTYNTRDSIVRDNPLPTVAAVQDLVWANASPGPGQQQQSGSAGGPAPVGLGSSMSKDQGWGKTVG